MGLVLRQFNCLYAKSIAVIWLLSTLNPSLPEPGVIHWGM